ncbi:MAG: DMT family transporter [Anaerolineales bacterium]
MSKTSGIDRLTLLAFAVVLLLGGSNAVAVRFSNLELPPFWGAAIRFGSAAVIFWVIVLSRRIPLPQGRALIGVIIFGLLSVGISYAFLYWALVYVSASLTMVVGTLVPLYTFFLAWAHGQERFRWRGLVGALVAFAGILIGIGPEIGSSVPILPLLALIGGGVALAEGAVLIKSYPKSDPLAVNAISLTTGTVFLLLISIFSGETRSLPASPTTWLSFAYLVLGGTVLLFYLYLYVLQRWTASATSYSFLLFPLVTILIASWLADEVISARFLVGGIFVLLGVWLGAFAPEKRVELLSEQVDPSMEG